MPNATATVPRLAKWPFLTGDALLLATAWVIYTRGPQPAVLWQLGLTALCVGLGAVFAILPFVLEYRAAVRLTEADAVAATVSRLDKLDSVADQIGHATGLWQTAQDAAEKTTSAASQIAERIAVEAKSFTEFFERANTGEKAALRLEVDKLKRAEADWVQVLVRVLDHVYALHQGALKSGQPRLADQVGRFQHACYDAARRVGLVPFAAGPAEPFNPERHQPVEGSGKAAGDGVVEETVASGYTYQGRIVRPALVRLRGNGGEPAKVAAINSAQGALPLEPEQIEPAQGPAPQ